MPTDGPPIAFFGTRQRLLQTLLVVLVLLGVITLFAWIVVFSAGTSSFSSWKSQSESGVKSDGRITETITPNASQLEQLKQYEQLKNRTKAPHVYSNVQTKLKCDAERDMGIIVAVQQAARNFCVDGGWDHVKKAPVSFNKATQVALFKVAGGIRSTTFQNLMLDFVNVSISRPIKSIAQDGAGHDPRFNFNMRVINCVCDELADYYAKLPGDKERRAEQIWQMLLMSLPSVDVPMPTVCAPRTTNDTKRSAWDFVKNPVKAPDKIKTVIFDEPVVLLARHDDHNPFFQVSLALNAWIMLKALKWDIAKTRVIHFDGGYPSPINALHKGLLAPNHEIIEAATLMGKRVHFRGNVLVASHELSGPMMEHLNDEEPCYDSELMKTFRAQSLLTVDITSNVERQLGVTTIRPMIVTVITRRPYEGRKLQRIWENEDEVMASMRIQYKGLKVEFRSIDYVNMTLFEQMKTTIESDMIISMHGAGLVNILWSRPMTTVVEIFPREKFRWGYRNICQLVGCDWHEFRGGLDTGDGKTPNEKNKRIPYDEWTAFFHPLFQVTYGVFEEQQAVLRGEKAQPLLGGPYYPSSSKT